MMTRPIPQTSSRRIPVSGSRVVIVGLILAGVLLGAGAATYWISHFAPQLRHSASKQATFPPAALVAIYLR